MKNGEGTSKDQNEATAAGGLLSGLLEQYHYQDKLMWSRIQFFIVAQGAVITASYILRHGYIWLSPFILLLGIIMTALLLFLRLRDKQFRELNVDLIKALELKLLNDSGVGGAI